MKRKKKNIVEYLLKTKHLFMLKNMCIPQSSFQWYYLKWVYISYAWQIVIYQIHCKLVWDIIHNTTTAISLEVVNISIHNLISLYIIYQRKQSLSFLSLPFTLYDIKCIQIWFSVYDYVIFTDRTLKDILRKRTHNVYVSSCISHL